MNVDGVWDLFTDPTVLAILVITALLAWPLGRRIAHRFGRSRRVGVLFVGAVGAVVALTATTSPLPRRHPTGPGRLAEFLGRLGDPHAMYAELASFGGDGDEWANVALFVPVGLVGCRLLRRALPTVALGVALTVLVESWQALVGRSCEVSDVLHNSVGGLLGVLLAVAVGHASRRVRRRAPVP